MGLFDALTGSLGLGGSSSTNLSYVSPAQVAQAYKNTQTGLQQQQDLLKSLQAQNGIQNQSDVFQQQQQLANALQAQSQGQGPNPAQAALANQTGANVSQQAALMAGQRGAGANAGLIARQAGQQGAGIQQQAVGQGAQMQAQQQLAAQQQLQAQQQGMAGLAGQQVSQQQGAVNQYQQGALGQQGQLLGGMAAQNKAANDQAAAQAKGNAATLGGVGQLLPYAGKALGSVWDAVAGMGSGIAGAGSGVLAGGGDAIAGGAGEAAGDVAMAAAHGGEVPEHLHAMASIYHPHMMSKGGKVPVMVSPGEAYLSPKDVKEVARGKEPLQAGKKFEGKAKVKGDSPKNDILPKNLDPGGMVIPRTVVNSDNPNEESKKFLAQELGKNSDHHGDFHDALKRAIEQRIRK